MVDLQSRQCKDWGKYLSEFKYKETVAIAAGLLTLPRLSANSIRCETLVHLAVAYSRGCRQPNRTTFKTVLNEFMGGSQVAVIEDPQEDVFVSNILTENGDLRVFNALWEANDYFTQTLIDITTHYQVPESLKKTRDSCISLLKLSEEVALRSGLSRNSNEVSFDKQYINVPKSEKYVSLAKRVTFTCDDLARLGVTIESIGPFIVSDDDILNLRKSAVGNSILERKPIIEIDGSYILSIPGSVGIAIRYCFLLDCKQDGSLGVFSKLLADYQAKQLMNDILREFKGRFKGVDPEVSTIENMPSMHAILLRDKAGIYINVVVLHDELVQIINEGMSSYHTPSEAQVEAFSKFVHEVDEYCKSQDDFSSGLSLITHGGLGRGYCFGFKKWPDKWIFSSANLNDLLLLSKSKSKPLEEFFQCIEQKQWMEDEGVKLSNVNGDFNYFGFWRNGGYKCIPDEAPVSEGTYISLGTDFVFPLRKGLRADRDKHSVKYIDGTWKRVERLTTDSFFMGMKKKPIYASTDHIDSGMLNGLIESKIIDLWFGAEFSYETGERSVVYEWWSAFIEAVEESLSFISSKVSFKDRYSFQVVIDFSKVAPSDETDLESQANRGAKIIWGADICGIQLESNFMANYARASNAGEKLILELILLSLAEYLAGKGASIGEYIDSAINHVLGDQAVRLIHIFISYDSVEHLLHRASRKPNFTDSRKTTFDRIRISKSLGLSSLELEGKHSCKSVLNRIVEEVWSRIKVILAEVNRRSMLSELVSLVNSIEQDRAQWRRTARAVFAIHSKHDDVVRVAKERESDRSLTSLCLRSLIEMSLIECPDDSGISVNENIISELLSLASLLVNTASDSDAIHWGLVPPKLIFRPNGTYFIPTDVMEEMLLPYFSGHFGIQFGAAIDDYEELYNVKLVERAEIQEGVFGEDFDDALSAEYGLLAHHVIECWAEIIDLHVETTQPVIIMGFEELVCRIVENRGLDENIVKRFFQAFTLYQRCAWDELPKGFSFRDIAPWKFKRRLSCLVKPILQISGDEVFLSLSLVRLGVSYFLDRAKEGEFNTEFFDSTIMRSYVGSMIEERGAAFTGLVASTLEAQGWYVRKELLMKAAGAPQHLGDIDVLAIKDGVMLVVECKKLQMAKTISEIADVCNRFRGEEKDDLRKHLDRVLWTSNNLNTFLQRINFKEEVLYVRGALLTSTEMPMKYKKDLPIASEDIISFRGFQDWLSTL